MAGLACRRALVFLTTQDNANNDASSAWTSSLACINLQDGRSEIRYGLVLAVQLHINDLSSDLLGCPLRTSFFVLQAAFAIDEDMRYKPRPSLCAILSLSDLYGRNL